MQFVMIFALVVAIFAVMFALQNPTAVTLYVGIWPLECPLGLLLLIAFALGVIFLSILTIPGWVKSKRFRSKHRKEVNDLEDSLAKYRTDLIDAQNSNKDLRLRVGEMESTQAKADAKIAELQEALDHATGPLALNPPAEVSEVVHVESVQEPKEEKKSTSATSFWSSAFKPQNKPEPEASVSVDETINAEEAVIIPSEDDEKPAENADTEDKPTEEPKKSSWF